MKKIVEMEDGMIRYQGCQIKFNTLLYPKNTMLVEIPKLFMRSGGHKLYKVYRSYEMFTNYEKNSATLPEKYLQLLLMPEMYQPA